MSEEELKKRILDLLAEARQQIPGRVVINGDDYLIIEILCPGSIPDMGYYCSLKPKHSGKCWTNNKKISFTPKKGS